ncbi:MAG: iron-sulfur cluster assembly accessory protein [Balneolales bacterium]
MSSQPLFDHQTEESAVNLTERAAQQVRKIITEDKLPDDQYLRIGVKGGGCAGMSYALGFDKKNDEDEIIEDHGIQVIVDKRHIMYLSGILVDFHDGLDARGFVFENPNASSTCGCGTSFSAG